MSSPAAFSSVSHSVKSSDKTASADSIHPPRRARLPPVPPVKAERRDGSPEVSSSSERAREFIEKLAVESEERPPLTCNILVDGQYKMLKRIGCGTFGNVYKAKDQKWDKMCAVKVIKSRHMQKDNILREVKVIGHILNLDPSCEKSLVVKMYRAFCHHKHLLIVYELLGPSLARVLYDNKHQGFSLYEVQQIGLQLATALNFLHSNGIIHHDIKPDNIAFVSPHCDFDERRQYKTMWKTDIRLVDFGSTTLTTEGPCTMATTKQYRAPEIGLHLYYCHTSDVWSEGCTLFELLSGRLLFPCKSEMEKYFQMERLFGKFPRKFGRDAKKSFSCFDAHGNLKYDDSTAEYRQYMKQRTFDEVLRMIDTNGEDASAFCSLLKEMLVIDSDHRIGSERILRHAFWTAQYRKPQILGLRETFNLSRN